MIFVFLISFIQNSRVSLPNFNKFCRRYCDLHRHFQSILTDFEPVRGCTDRNLRDRASGCILYGPITTKTNFPPLKVAI